MNQKKSVFPPGIEPGTLRVWGARDNHYTTETTLMEICFSNNKNASTVNLSQNAMFTQ